MCVCVCVCVWKRGDDACFDRQELLEHNVEVFKEVCCSKLQVSNFSIFFVPPRVRVVLCHVTAYRDGKHEARGIE